MHAMAASCCTNRSRSCVIPVLSDLLCSCCLQLVAWQTDFDDVGATVNEVVLLARKGLAMQKLPGPPVRQPRAIILHLLCVPCDKRATLSELR